MTHRRWITVFIASFLPLGIWLMFWLVRLVTLQSGGLSLAFVVPTAVYVCFQVWLAFRALTS
jgi:hypothetical protein